MSSDSDLDRGGVNLVFAALALPYLAMVWRFWWVCEDAFITFRYSRNLARGFGPRFNLSMGEIPVEGYSNFGWMVLAAIPEAFGVEPSLVMPWLSVAAGLVTLRLILHVLHDRMGLSLAATAAGGLFAASSVPLAVWSTSGLATVPFALAMLLSTIGAVHADSDRGSRLTGVAMLALALLRAEGVYWALTLLVLAAIARWLGSRRLRPLAAMFAVLCAGYLPYLLWRIDYYLSIAPNTAHAKLSLNFETLARGLQYNTWYVVLMIVPALWLPGAWFAARHERRDLAFPYVVMALAVPVWAMVVSGDYMPFFRMLVAGVPFLAITVGFLWDRIAHHRILMPALALASAGVGILPAFNIVLAPRAVAAATQTRLIRLDKLIKQQDDVDARTGRLFGMDDERLTELRSELQRWNLSVRAIPERRRIGKTLRQTLGPDARVVHGAIGAIGYFSDLYIYDQNGLVNLDVARRARSVDDHALVWPGHDAYVNKAFFAGAMPDVLAMEIIRMTHPQPKLRTIGIEWDKERRRRYYPLLVEVEDTPPGESMHLLLQRRGTPQETKEGWREWRRLIMEKPAKKSAPEPSDPDLAIGGRWRTLTTVDDISDEALAELKALEAIGYLSGSMAPSDKPIISRHQPERVQPGINLVVSGHAPSAKLIDAQGTELHTWTYAFDDVWPDYPIGDDHESRGYWRRVLLLEDGGLLVIHEGLGILRLDRDSKLVWAQSNRAHHDVRIGRDGAVYTLTRIAHDIERIHNKRPTLEDFITVLDLETGEERASISLLESFEASEFEDAWKRDRPKRDIFHANSLFELDGALEGKVAGFAEGRWLVSMRNISALAVFDLEQRKVTWAHTGDFALQHDARILPNGHLLFLDNGQEAPSSVVELDLATLAESWRFEGSEAEPFYTRSCGTAARLANGNTLVVESDPGRAFEVTSQGELVWEYSSPYRAGPGDAYVATLFQVERIAPPAWLPAP